MRRRSHVLCTTVLLSTLLTVTPAAGDIAPGVRAGDDALARTLHGGDLAGLTGKVDYLAGLGSKALWINLSGSTAPIRIARSPSLPTETPTASRSTSRS